MLFNEFLNVNPWREMDRIQREMNRLFESVAGVRRSAYPAMNLYSNDEAAVLTTELPGYDPKDIHLSVTGNELNIRGTRPRYEVKEGEQIHRQERFFGEFERTVQLPYEVDAEKVEAQFRNGVLTITLPRAEADKPKKIEVKMN